MFSSISTSEFFVLAMIVPAGVACIAVMGKKFITDMKTQKPIVKGPMAIRNKP